MALYGDVFSKNKSTLLSLIVMFHFMVPMLVSLRPPLRLSNLDSTDESFSKMSMDMFNHVIDAKELQT